uniref:Uncharacterized protein n=1 Tax=Rhizophagus irregularis (strain DAOM 181602 / DAOM 197198 / MUCL 43194) TaxID=747089 RepID=U9TSY8_RHIID
MSYCFDLAKVGIGSLVVFFLMGTEQFLLISLGLWSDLESFWNRTISKNSFIWLLLGREQSWG